MKIFLIVCLGIILSQSLFAGDEFNSERYVKVPFNLGIYPGYSISDMMAEETGKRIYINGFSLSLIGNRAHRLKGFDLSGIFSVYREEVVGFQGSGIFNISGGDITGFQGAGIFNISDASIRGIQGSGIFNINNGEIQGIQGSGIFNINNGSVRGIQGAGIFNINNGDIRGIQGSAIFNVNNGTVRGIQGSNIFNIQNGDIHGIQGASIFNISNGDLNGSQLSGIVNVLSGELHGLQAGMVNVARYVHSGVQIGFVNIAEHHSGVPIGLFTYVPGVPIRYPVWYSGDGFVLGGVRSGNGKWYNLFAGGKRVNGDLDFYALGGGFGRFIVINRRIGLDIGISSYQLFDEDFKAKSYGQLSKLNVLFQFEIGSRAALIVGPEINVWVSKLATEDLSVNSWYDEEHDEHFVRIWPSFQIGLKL